MSRSISAWGRVCPKPGVGIYEIFEQAHTKIRRLDSGWLEIKDASFDEKDFLSKTTKLLGAFVTVEYQDDVIGMTQYIAHEIHGSNGEHGVFHACVPVVLPMSHVYWLIARLHEMPDGRMRDRTLEILKRNA